MKTETNQDANSFDAIFDRLEKRAKSSGMYYDGSIFDKGESAKVILNATSKGKSSDDQSV